MANIMKTSESAPTLRRARDRDFFGFLDPFRSTMRDMLRFDPFREFDLLGSPLSEGQFVPSVDVKETKDAYLFRVDLPGVKDEEVDVSVTGRQLRISGRREEEEREVAEGYYARERVYGDFARTFVLPEGVDTEGVRADMASGVLTVSLPKKPEVQPKRIQLTGKGGEMKGKEVTGATASTSGKATGGKTEPRVPS